MRLAYVWTAAAIFLALPGGCGGKVVLDRGAGGGAVGSGGAGGQGGGAAAQGCGTFTDPPCPADRWCQFLDVGLCGQADGAGTCRPRPTSCFGDCNGVCGCDGLTYCNACDANAAGVDTSSSGCETSFDAGAPSPGSG